MLLHPNTMPAAASVALPAAPILAVNAKQAALLSVDGEIALLPHARARTEVHRKPVVVCHAPYTRQRLGAEDIYAYDVLELFAFVHPAKFCAPTPAGLARALGIAVPKTFEDLPLTIMEAATALLKDLRDEPRRTGKSNPLDVAGVMGLMGKGWNWTPYIFAALGQTYDPEQLIAAKTALNVWKNMPQ
jgi:ATP-dependent DNA helicase DinG